MGFYPPLKAAILDYDIIMLKGYWKGLLLLNTDRGRLIISTPIQSLYTLFQVTKLEVLIVDVATNRDFSVSSIFFITK